MSRQDFDSAETMMKKGLDLGMPMKEAEVQVCCKWACWPCKRQ